MQVQVRAAAGALPDAVYAAVDVCLDDTITRRCNLQVAQLHNELGGGLTPASTERVTPFTINALRDSTTDRLDDVALVPLTPRSMLLSGVIGANTADQRAGDRERRHRRAAATRRGHARPG